jgi:hypothetical protein
MAWARLDDRSHENAKLLAVGLDGTGLHFRAVSWCSAHETDGVLPAHVVAVLAPGVRDRDLNRIVGWLLEVAPGQEHPLWHEDTPGVYRLHGFLDYNPSADEVAGRRLELHEVRAAAGRNGGIRSGAKRQAKGKQT